MNHDHSNLHIFSFKNNHEYKDMENDKKILILQKANREYQLAISLHLSLEKESKFSTQ